MKLLEYSVEPEERNGLRSAVVKVQVGDSDPERPRRDSGQFMLWRLISPEGGESCRWMCSDGRWVALMLGHDAELGSVVVTDSTGRRVTVDSYEGGLALAHSWRT
jgi:hypothetical protein